MAAHSVPCRAEEIPPPSKNQARRSQPFALLPWRWWWNTSLLLIISSCILQYWTEKNWSLLRGRMNIAAGAIMVALWVGLAVWLFFIVPWLCARDQTPRFRAPPRTYFAALRLLVWTPVLLIAGEMLFELMYVTALHYFQTGTFRLRLPWWYLLPASLALAATIWYARGMTRLLQSRIRAQAAQSQHCFECGYPLHSLAARRCPECGQSFLPHLQKNKTDRCAT